MKFNIKLPKSYYQYSNLDLSKLDKVNEDASVTINLSAYISCKLEHLALDMQKPVQDVLKLIIIGEGVLTEDELVLSGRDKRSSKFFGVDCSNLKDIGATKLYRVFMSEYAKGKFMQKLLNDELDASFFIKKSLVKKVGKREYEILEISDIGM